MKWITINPAKRWHAHWNMTIFAHLHIILLFFHVDTAKVVGNSVANHIANISGGNNDLYFVTNSHSLEPG